MALTPQIRATQGALLGLGGATLNLRVTVSSVIAAINFPTPQVRATQAYMLAAIKFPAAGVRATTASGMIYAKPTEDLRVTSASVLAYVRGRISDHKVRAWTFTLDGHDFYVLRLGMILTLVYDDYSEQWMDWDAFTEVYWPVNTGINWVGGTGLLDTNAQSFGSNVLVGDDTYGLLWLLDPNQPFDQHPEAANPVQDVYFPRVLQGQYPINGRQAMPCYAVWLTTDMGAPAYVGAGVQLEISDDAGASYQDMGTVTVTLDVNAPEVAWYSLGQIMPPGRLFRITDDGAVARIDAMEMNDPDDK